MTKTFSLASGQSTMKLHICGFMVVKQHRGSQVSVTDTRQNSTFFNHFNINAEYISYLGRISAVPTYSFSFIPSVLQLSTMP